EAPRHRHRVTRHRRPYPTRRRHSDLGRLLEHYWFAHHWHRRIRSLEAESAGGAEDHGSLSRRGWRGGRERDWLSRRSRETGRNRAPAAAAGLSWRRRLLFVPSVSRWFAPTPLRTSATAPNAPRP